MDADPGAVYEDVRQAFSSMLRAVAAGAERTVVPATPDWTVHDVVAHVVGLTADLNRARFPTEDDPGGEAWTAAQVQSRADHSIAELLTEWDTEAPAFEDGLRTFGDEVGVHFVGDLVTHFHDVREALAADTETTPTALALALDHYLTNLDIALGRLGDGGIRVITPEREATLGPAPAVATLEAPGYDVLRVCSARRSRVAITALSWSGDVETAVSLLERVFVDGYSLPD